jgi:hypothetical protein
MPCAKKDLSLGFNRNLQKQDLTGTISPEVGQMTALTTL